MAQFKRLDVLRQAGEQGVIPVMYHPDPEILKNIVKACYEGGIRSFEFTNRGDFAHEVFSELNKWVLSELPGMTLGVGSIVEAGTASIYMQLGANFIVSPILSEEMAKVCNRRKVAWMPGCGTLSEISKAEELGAEIVKVFPASSIGGPSFVKNILGPSPWSNIMPTGGVEPTQDNLKAWFDAGVYCVGMGSKLITRDIIKDQDFDQLKQKCQNIIQLIKEIRDDK
ncbi:MAG: bifunctional 4-hydroxy-2-oxoglutarate aldolase/2-dehydro-3-deoxy-phosphogluconate aldolase [bacterium]